MRPRCSCFTTHLSRASDCCRTDRRNSLGATSLCHVCVKKRICPIRYDRFQQTVDENSHFYSLHKLRLSLWAPDTMSWKASKKRGLHLWCSIKVMRWFAMLLLQKLIGLAVQGSASRRGHFTLQPASSQSGHFVQTFLSTLAKFYGSTIHECVFICEHSKNLHAQFISLRDFGIPGRHLSLGFSLASTEYRILFGYIHST